MEGITIQSNRGGTIYKDKDGNEIDPPKEKNIDEKKEAEKPKKHDKDRYKE